MKYIKKIYWATIYIFGIAFCIKLCSKLYAPIYIKRLIVCVIAFFPALYSYLTMLLGSFVNKWVLTLLDTLGEKLPHDEFKKLILSLILKIQAETLGDGLQIANAIYQCANDNFSESSKEMILDEIGNAIERLDNSVISKPIQIAKALNMKIHQLLLLRALGDFESDTHSICITILEWVLTELHFVFPCITVIIFFYFKTFFSFCCIPIVLVATCLANGYIVKRIRFSQILIGVSWFVDFYAIAVSPLTMSYDFFMSTSGFFALLFSQFTLILTGLWITNKLWKSTSIESKNKGRFISSKTFIEIVEVNILKKFRYIWLWITFIFVIFFLILMYMLIYKYQLDIGDSQYCFLLSLSLYFGGGNTVYDSIDGFYFSSEIIISFFVNTLYIANIVRLILEPKLAKI